VNKLRANLLWSTASQVLAALLGMIPGIVFARADPSGHINGLWAHGSAWVVWVWTVFNMQLRTVVASDAEGEFRFSDYLGFRVLSLGLYALAIVGIGVGVGVTGSGSGLSGFLVIVAIGAMRATDLIADILFAYLQRHDHIAWISWSVGLRALIATGSVAGLYVAGLSLEAAALLGAGLLALEILLFGRPLLMHAQAQLAADPQRAAQNQQWLAIRPTFEPKRLLALLSRSWPIGFSGSLGMLWAQMPIFVVKSQLGTEAVGRFSLMYNPIMTAQIFIAAALEGVFSRIAIAFHERNKQLFWHLVGRLNLIALGLAVALVTGVLVLGKLFLKTVYGPAFAEEAGVFTWLALSGGLGFLAVATSAPFSAIRRFRLVFWLAVSGMPVSIALLWFWVATQGTVGAAWVMSLTHGFSIVVFGALLLLSVRPQLEAESRQRAPVTPAPEQ